MSETTNSSPNTETQPLAGWRMWRAFNLRPPYHGRHVGYFYIAILTLYGTICYCQHQLLQGLRPSEPSSKPDEHRILGIVTSYDLGAGIISLLLPNLVMVNDETNDCWQIEVYRSLSYCS